METNTIVEATEISQEQPAGAGAPMHTPPPQSVRRVGTITAGVVLILSGIVLCISLFNREFDYLLLCKFAPLLLVLLGAEVLLSQLCAKRMRLKYDFLSMLLCFFVLCCTMAALCVPLAMRYYSPERQVAETKLAQQWEESLYAELKGNPHVDTVSATVYLPDLIDMSTVNSLDALNAFRNNYLTVELSGNFATKEAFLQACEPVINAVKKSGVKSDQFNIRTPQRQEAIAYEIHLEGPYQMDKEPKQLADKVYVWYREEDGSYVDDSTKKYLQAQREEEEQQIADEMDTSEEADISEVTASQQNNG